jgi:hypothetical protein
LINNRQNGRRRGRGGGAPRPNGGGGGDRGNRIDNRARGNAAQLHEKYKALARDAQMQGDRVMTEYYLQFADHYFRVLSENRARFDDQQQQRPRRDEWSQQGDFQDDYEDEAGGPSARDERSAEPRGNDREEREDRGGDQRFARDQREPRDQRNGRFDDRRPHARDRFAEPRERGDERQSFAAAPAPAQAEQPVASEEEPRAARRRGRPPRAAAPAEADGSSDRLAADLLPPSFTAELPLGAEGGSDAEAKPRRRGRKPKADSVAAEA